MTGAADLHVFIVTYKRNEVLNANLRSLFAGATSGRPMAVTVLANHPAVEIDADNRRPELAVRLNTTRPPDAWGYLARDWNYGILTAFGDSANRTGVRWCVLAQNDVEWHPGWDERLLATTDYDIVTQPPGDQVVALTIAAVRAIGFFDERFTTLHYQEQDYFLRAILALGPRASITDAGHGPEPEKSSWNPLGPVLIRSHLSALGDEELHNSRNWKAMARFICDKWQLPSYVWLHDKPLFARTFTARFRRTPREVNWYPFFWKSPEPATALFIDHVPARVPVARRVALAMRWRLGRR